MPISGYLFGFGAVTLLVVALYFVVKRSGKKEEELDNMSYILKEIDRQIKQKQRRDEKIRNKSIDDKLNEL